MNLPDQTTTDNQIKAYAELVQLYPDNETYLQQYADLLVASGQLTIATAIIRQLHQLLLQNGETARASQLSMQHPQVDGIHVEPRHSSIAELLPDNMQNSLWQRLHRQRHQTGQSMATCGTPANALFLICSGEVSAFIPSDQTDGTSGEQTLLKLFYPGDIIGEEALQPAARWTASYIANHETISIRLPHAALLKAMQHKPVLKQALLRQRQYHERLKLIASCPLLRDIPLPLRSQLAEESELTLYPADTTIYRAGEPLKQVSIITTGTARYSLGQSTTPDKSTLLVSGSLLAVPVSLNNHSSPADLISDRPLELLNIPLSSFSRAMQSFPALQRNVAKQTSALHRLIMQML